MLTQKDRDERARSIRAHLLKYSKTGSVDELTAALAELVILMRLEGAPHPNRPVPPGDPMAGVISGLTDAEVDGFLGAVREDHP